MLPSGNLSQQVIVQKPFSNSKNNISFNSSNTEGEGFGKKV